MKWKLADVAGIGVYVHWSFWILPAWIVLAGAGSGLAGAIVNVAFVFAIFGCVILHELGHALMARYFGIGTRDITIYPIGGVASLNRMPTRPSQELAIALAGPAVNVVIAAALFVVLLIVGVSGSLLAFDIVSGSFLLNLLIVNVGLVLFNLLPAFPMDGGRVLRAILAMRMSHLRATEIAARIGQAAAMFFGLVGLLTGGTLLFVAMFVFLAASAELAMARRMAFAAAPYDYRDAPGPPTDQGIFWVTDLQPGQTSPGRTRRVIFVGDSSHRLG